MVVTTDTNRLSIHRTVYFVALCLIAVFLPLSRYLLTVSEILLIVNWLAEADFRARFNRLKNDRAAIAFVLIYAVNVIGLLWSRDTDFALRQDLLHKLPTLFLPVIFATTPVPHGRKIRIMLLLFIISVLVVSIIGFFSTFIHSDPYFRDASPYIPGIYFSMMLIIAAFQLPLLVKQQTGSGLYFYLSLAISAWLLFFLLYLRALSAVASLIAVMIFLVIIMVRKADTLFVKIIVPAAFLLLAGLAAWPLTAVYQQVHAEAKTDFSSLPAYTALGTPYLHDTVNIIRENGNPVYIYLADDELRDAWNEMSDLDFDGRDLMGQELKYTLYRYMSSLGIRKDSEGFSGLTGNDIREIEKGTTNYLNVRRPGIYIRAYEELMSLHIYQASSRRETSWGSLTKRIDLWRASLEAFKKHPVTGWGTGSILKAMDYGTGQTGSKLSGLNMKPHSQYLYILLTLGIAGLAAIAFLYGYFVIRKRAYQSFMFVVFLIVFLVNFAGNNSLESQPGQDLFVFFSLIYGYFYPLLKKEPGFIY
ncbi:MAG: O-antigen ligase family protein [Bacteroidales bacterium]|nr:O-antigen ligase family protein [Bacteroidales bacterium]